MKITDISIKRPMLVTVLIIIVLLLGGVSFTRLSIDLFPELELPVGVVMTQYPGVGPEEIEQQITRPMESVLSTVSGLDNIYSTSSKGSSTVMLMFDWGRDMDFAMLEMRESVDLIRQSLPDGAQAPMIIKADLNMLPIVQVAAHSPNPQLLKQAIDDTIQPRLERTSGVASVWYVGGWEPEIHVLADPVKLNGYNLTLDGLVASLRAENMNISAGTVEEGSKDLLLRVTGEFENLDQVRQVVIGAFGDTPVHLGDVARVIEGQKEITEISRVNGEPGMTLMINKQSDTNTVEVAKKVKAELEKLQSEIDDIHFTVIMDQSEYIEISIKNLAESALIGALLAIFIILIFLRNFRSTLIIATSIPIAIIGAFVMLYLNDMTLNMITMGGLALGIGLIVDDAIVVLENIFRFQERGVDRITAAKDATSEVGGAVIASSLTIVAVFLPIIFVEGLAAQLFKPMALSISFCIMASLITAITLVPLLASRWQGKREQAPAGTEEDVKEDVDANRDINNSSENKDPKPRKSRLIYSKSEQWFEKLDNAYRRLLALALRRRKSTILVVLVIFIGSLFTIPLVGVEFMPTMDQGYVTISLEMPKGTPLASTDHVVAEVEERLQQVAGIDSVTSNIGSTGSMMGGGSSHLASIILKLTAQSGRELDANQLADQVRTELKGIPGAEIEVSALESGMGMGGDSPVSLKIIGDDMDVLSAIGDQVAALVRDVPGTREVSSSMEEKQPELCVLVHRDRAAMYGLSLAEIASTVRTSFDGTVATQYRVGGDETDIRVKLDNTGPATISGLSNLTVTSRTGIQVPLGMVTEIREEKGPNAIQRENQSRVVMVNSQLAERDLGSVVEDIKQRLDTVDLPPGYMIEFGGEQEQMADAFGSLGLALILAVILVYLVMVAQFESLLHPFVIMFSLPVTLTGVVLGLLITGRTFSVPAFIGVIMLAGIVVKNAIVLVDYINVLRRRGMECKEAILQAGPTRLRPILMTALTTIMAMLPMAIGIGEGSEGQTPLATAVVFGLAFSTLITLVLVPVIYSIADDLTKKKIWRWRRKKLKADNSITP